MSFPYYLGRESARFQAPIGTASVMICLMVGGLHVYDLSGYHDPITGAIRTPISFGRPWEAALANQYYKPASTTEEERFGVIANLASRLITQSQDLDPAIVNIVDRDFWKLI